MSSDPYIQRMWMDMDAWLRGEQEYCRCDDVCRCGWDDVGKYGGGVGVVSKVHPPEDPSPVEKDPHQP